jgi:hypothetical protein
MSKQPHITHPLEEARRLINNANHHTYRAGRMDTAYEISRAVKQLGIALQLLQEIQKTYAIADPATIDTSIAPDDPRIAPCELGEDES